MSAHANLFHFPLLQLVSAVHPDAITCLVVRSLDRDGLVEVSVEIKIR